MKIAFCGGAGEVGASCFLVQMDEKNILLDCGVRLKSGSKDILPDFRKIQEIGGVDAIIVSHAHLDHSGSLPIISREYPLARIYMTHATKELINVLLWDSLKVMNHKEGEIPIYAEAHVRGMMEQILCYSPNFNFKPFPDRELSVTFYPAGHIAGAALIYIRGEEGTLLYTGDLSLTRQQTVNGAFIPALRPDVMISESTYGDKLHSNREIEENRLVEMVKEVIDRGGKVLFPAFALGRAQEIILLLKKAMNKKQLPPVKIYVDGMIKDINRIYRLNPNYLRESLAKKVLNGNEIFYDDQVIPVEGQELREAIAGGKESLCVIAGSGMLTGGYSPWYAERIAAGEDNYLALTGYQDEESPGRQLLNLISEEEKVLNLNGKSVPVKCRTGLYGLSAHGDKGELQSVIYKLAPRKIFLVHGDREIIASFAKQLNGEIWAEIYAPANGEEYEVKIRNPRKQFVRSEKIEPLYRKELLTSDNIQELWRYLVQQDKKDPYSIEELADIWSGPGERQISEMEEMRNLLNHTGYFEPDSRRLFLYHPVPEEPPAEESGVMEMNQMLAFLDQFFPEESGLYKKGARFEERKALLYFKFPLRALALYSELIKEFEAKSGWKVEVNAEYNVGAVEDMVGSLFPEEIHVSKFSFYRAENTVSISLDQVPEELEEIQQKFTALTGLRLKVNLPGVSSEPLTLQPVEPEKMMEQNQAFALIDDYFRREAAHQIYRKSRKETGGVPYLELSFISPQAGEKYRELLRKLESETGWNIVIGKNPNQNEIIKKAREICRSAGISLSKNPALHTDQGVVRLKTAGSMEKEVLGEIKRQFEEETGYRLELD
jgi:Cft2 family RNA processing exonuclease